MRLVRYTLCVYDIYDLKIQIANSVRGVCAKMSIECCVRLIEKDH